MLKLPSGYAAAQLCDYAATQLWGYVATGSVATGQHAYYIPSKSQWWPTAILL